jgi:hypothetical protein
MQEGEAEFGAEERREQRVLRQKQKNKGSWDKKG